jgi:hypothetical protein
MGVRSVDPDAVDASDNRGSAIARRKDTTVLSGKAAIPGDIQRGGAFGNAVADALAPRGINQLDIPLESERVWRTIQDQEGS